MSRLPQLYVWLETLSSAFTNLSPAQVRGLAWFSFGMVLARSCSVTAVAVHLADLLQQKRDSVKQRLAEWYKEADAKAGRHRCQIDVRACFSPLLAWILKDWPCRRLALALDATTLGQRFVTLSISVLYRGCATAVAWKILPATGKHPWKAEWLSLLKEFRQEIPPGWTVVVMTDRGLYAKWLFQAIQRQGWHPFRRINTKGSFRPVGDKQRRALQTFVPAVGTAWKGAGEAFKERPTAALHAARPLGRRVRRPVVGADGSGRRGGRRVLVRTANLDRAGFQTSQERRLGLAVYTHDRPGAGRAAVAGDGRGQLVVLAGRRRGRDPGCVACGNHRAVARAGFEAAPSAPGRCRTVAAEVRAAGRAGPVGSGGL